MEVLLFLPGILGSKLSNSVGEEVWPPTPAEVLTGYRRIDKLLAGDVRASGVIESVCIDVYGKVLRALRGFGYTPHSPTQKLVPYAYDWRKDLLGLARELDGTLAKLVTDHGGDVEIRLVCHSMGGLVARACLEQPDVANRPWAKAVKLAVYLATPHDGAPLAFARAIGVGGGSLGLSQADLRRLSAAAGYPAAYQLLPPERLEAIWDLDAAIPFATRNFFDPELVELFELNADHLRAAKALHAALDVRRKPEGCRYFAVVSASHETVTRFNRVGDEAGAVKVKSSGDGTVPILSAAALPIQTAFVEANHIGVTQKEVTHQIVGMLLEKLPVEPVIALGAPAGPPSLSVSERMVAEGDQVEILIHAAELDRLSAVVRIRRDEGGADLVPVAELDVTVEAPGLTKVELRAPGLDVGRYELDLLVDGAIADSEELLVSRSAAA